MASASSSRPAAKTSYAGSAVQNRASDIANMAAVIQPFCHGHGQFVEGSNSFVQQNTREVVFLLAT